ncbi:hypothetical protein ACLOJK_014104 [Asimina triloba]
MVLVQYIVGRSGTACADAHQSLLPTSFFLHFSTQLDRWLLNVSSYPLLHATGNRILPPSVESINDVSLRRYVHFASENCIQELLSASDPNRADHADDRWKILAFHHNGVEISKRRSRSGGSLLYAFRSRWLLKSAVSPHQLLAVANAIDAAKQWDDDLVEAKHIKNIGDNLSIIRLRFGDSAKPLFRNREFVVYERRETLDDGTLVVAVASLPKEIATGLQPKGNNAIRGLVQSGWVVEKQLDDHSFMVTYVIQLPTAKMSKEEEQTVETKRVVYSSSELQ